MYCLAHHFSKASYAFFCLFPLNRVLNNSTGRSGIITGTWRPGPFLRTRMWCICTWQLPGANPSLNNLVAAGNIRQANAIRLFFWLRGKRYRQKCTSCIYKHKQRCGIHYMHPWSCCSPFLPILQHISSYFNISAEICGESDPNTNRHPTKKTPITAELFPASLALPRFFCRDWAPQTRCPLPFFCVREAPAWCSTEIPLIHASGSWPKCSHGITRVYYLYIFMTMRIWCIIVLCWLVVSTPVKDISQLGLLFLIYGKIIQMLQTTNQYGICMFHVYLSSYNYLPTFGWFLR